jgi:hypothetical protein
MQLKPARLDHRIVEEQASFSISPMQNSPFWKFPKIQARSYSLIGKVILASGILAIGIKELGPKLKVPATLTVVWAFILLPTVLMGLALGLQYCWQRRQVRDL